MICKQTNKIYTRHHLTLLSVVALRSTHTFDIKANVWPIYISTLNEHHPFFGTHDPLRSIQSPFTHCPLMNWYKFKFNSHPTASHCWNEILLNLEGPLSLRSMDQSVMIVR